MFFADGKCRATCQTTFELVKGSNLSNFSTSIDKRERERGRERERERERESERERERQRRQEMCIRVVLVS